MNAIEQAIKVLDQMDERLDAHGYLQTDNPRVDISQATTALQGLQGETAALVGMVEGLGCKRWQDEHGNRLKDTREWARFYVATKNSPVQPKLPDAVCPHIISDSDGTSYCGLAANPNPAGLVPPKPTITSTMKAKLMGEFSIKSPEYCHECMDKNGPDESCKVCSGKGEYFRSINVPWIVMKDIFTAMYVAMVEEFPVPEPKVPVVTPEMQAAGMTEWDKAHKEGVNEWPEMVERVYLAMFAAQGAVK